MPSPRPSAILSGIEKPEDGASVDEGAGEEPTLNVDVRVASTVEVCSTVDVTARAGVTEEVGGVVEAGLVAKFPLTKTTRTAA